MHNVIEITPEEYQALVKTQEVILCDIREPDEHNRERIADAINTPLSSLHQQDIKSLAKGKVVVFHCLSGNRTKQNAHKFADTGAVATYIMSGGMNAWKKSNYATITDEKAPLPIMRQVQIVAGFLILLGVVLSYLISPVFILLSGFVGAGLMFAGISGFCGMANILMFLPYNKRQCQASCVKK
jgi:rhodanese-related sulfurtransferase